MPSLYLKAVTGHLNLCGGDKKRGRKRPSNPCNEKDIHRLGKKKKKWSERGHHNY